MVSLRSEEVVLANYPICADLEEVANLLEAQGANRFRVRAYRRAADTVRGLKVPVLQVLRGEGIDGLLQLPGIGRSLAHTISHSARSGRLPLLERLRGENVAERIFATVPDIGPGLAHRIHEQLGIETLTDLEEAAHDGRLSQVPGMGAKRIRAVRESLAGRFARVWRQDQVLDRQPSDDETPVYELLRIDAQYRCLARQKKLPLIAPRRFNPTGAAWLPVLHTQQGGRHYTALFSNSARAHELGTTHDWVIIYRDDDDDHGCWTVITSHFGRLRGRRIVRGREQDCGDYYNRAAAGKTTVQ